MSKLAEILTEEMKEIARREIAEFVKPLEPFRDLPLIATTGEVADALRVSKEVLARMAEDGMPHSHAGRELRFSKAMIVEWTVTGKIYNCDVCNRKTEKDKTEVVQNVFELSPQTNKKLAEIAGGRVK